MAFLLSLVIELSSATKRDELTKTLSSMLSDHPWQVKWGTTLFDSSRKPIGYLGANGQGNISCRLLLQMEPLRGRVVSSTQKP